ncbi:DUF5667 domain-containing protein [Candidatus Nitrosopumilus sediminis]|uniref:DUF5667 domain-containing protein n=1 Tax=Candidatus Nitrosopumilus sediminis TaxID=1229909 RepID=K0BCV5_9ARCH|nr:DUF5667 domain-containing protein [Candidatus Nitrosopumilus sediminis]AFS82206.1 hypothetical protein NSED_01980 [Candidatus Nitrosopumilus sediminis]
MNQYSITALLTISLLIMTIPSIYAQSIDDLPEPGTTPDSFVYGFKKAFEGLDLAFTFNQNDKVTKHLKFAELRLSEANAMVQKGMPEQVDDLTKDYEKQVSDAKKIADSASKAADKASLTEDIVSASSKHVEVLTELKDTLPEQAQLRIQVIIDNSKKDIGIAMKELSNYADAMEKSEEMKKTAEDHKSNSTGTEKQDVEYKDDAMVKSEEMKKTAEDYKP